MSAAHGLFAMKGYSQVSMDDIAKAAGVSKRTVYAYYKTKDDLFSAFLESYCETLHLTFEEQLDQDANLSECLYGFARTFLSCLLTQERIDFYRILLSESVPLPHIGAKFLETGPNHCARILAQFFIDYSLKKNTPLPASAEALANSFIGAAITKIHLRLSLTNSPPPSESEIHDLAKLTADIYTTYLETQKLGF